MSKHKLHQRSAIIYQSLYLMNLLLLPGIAFIILLWLFYKNSKQLGWQRIHLYRAIQLSLLAGLLVIIMPLIIIFTAKKFEAYLLAMILYCISVHTAFVMMGMLNLARAMARKVPFF